MQCPIPSEELEASFSDPSQPLFLPPEAYKSEAFYQFEREAVWRRQWLMIGRLEEIPEPGDYFSIEIDGEPLIVVRGDDGAVTAMSAVCRHRGMFVAQGRGHCGKALVCPYHEWAYDRAGTLIGAPQAIEMTRRGIGLPAFRTELWHGFIFVNFDDDAAPLAPRLATLEKVVAPYALEDLRGEFTTDPDYRFEFDYDWNWKVYADGQNECYHCDKIHGDTPVIQNSACARLSFGVQDAANGVFQFTIPGKEIDVTLNHLGKAIWPPIPTLSEQQRWETHGVTIAPNVTMILMPDSVIVLSFFPTGPRSMRVKRHRLYPQATLARPDFAERHRAETEATRAFVSQDDDAFALVQRGINSDFAARGPIAVRERALVGFTRWLIDRYHEAAQQPPAPAPVSTTRS
ncbi:aromatic ring-hydroxylating oxygenase subunit alpha [Streptomyces sp. 6N223]|uniref:aromatic ring-hydroxylating oxygenase subunit alpha n=1 Tax=Streptomyces sp. 6N223 TaxID=3457412 RepID=UPI003FD35EE3